MRSKQDFFPYIPAVCCALLIGCEEGHAPDPATPVNEVEPRNAASASAPDQQSADPADPLRNVYFGETHVHTTYSLDAYLGGNRLMPSDAYRFAKGMPVTVNGEQRQLAQPLDFVAVTDHAEYLGEMYSTHVDSAPGHDHELLQQLRGLTGLEERREWVV